MTISALKEGDKAKIISYNKDNKQFRKKLLAMGLLPGTEILVKRFAPLGDPIEIVLRGFSIMLRKFEANIINVELITGCGKGCCTK